MNINSEYTTLLGSEGQLYYWPNSNPKNVKQLKAEPITQLFPGGRWFIAKGQSGSFYLSDASVPFLDTIETVNGVKGFLFTRCHYVAYTDTKIIVSRYRQICHEEDYGQPIKSIFTGRKSILVQTETTTYLYIYAYEGLFGEVSLQRETIQMNQKIVDYVETYDFEYYLLDENGNVYAIENETPVLIRENVRQLIPLERPFACVYLDGTVECPGEEIHVGSATVYPFYERFAYADKNRVFIPSLGSSRVHLLYEKLLFYKPTNCFQLEEDVYTIGFNDIYVVIVTVLGRVYTIAMEDGETKWTAKHMEKIDFFDNHPAKATRRMRMKNARSA